MHGRDGKQRRPGKDPCERNQARTTPASSRAGQRQAMSRQRTKAGEHYCSAADANEVLRERRSPGYRQRGSGPVGVDLPRAARSPRGRGADPRALRPHTRRPRHHPCPRESGEAESVNEVGAVPPGMVSKSMRTSVSPSVRRCLLALQSPRPHAERSDVAGVRHLTRTRRSDEY
ncbi:hypothetical protein PYCCODRAFT_1098281 [Trametes coccinea BRFM310]|uniref:Uncharacterized protein n=1 Tax=Trametes coccinea (strain BRFM310) TaxID=1353009 RepID=A0A1Y2IBS0_TRAC3|nr:hypothetical protein PYCCODRAFT_1098281 [Trametes coccinea BRFM310]